MKAILIRVGIDQAYGKWNAPVDESTGEFVYVPIPESSKTVFHAKMGRPYSEVIPHLENFSSIHGIDLYEHLKFPRPLLQEQMHLDPDFETLTYGDQGARRGASLLKFKQGDLLVFYAGLKPIHKSKQKLIYALVGIFVVNEIVMAKDIPQNKWRENAHTRKTNPGAMDVVVRAQPSGSGRLKHCIPIGEYRERAYRVRKDILVDWGGLSVLDGYIQRSAVPPIFSNPARFKRWFYTQKPELFHKNF